MVASLICCGRTAVGVDATSPSVLNLSGNIAKRGEYNALMSLSEGENQAAGLYNQGQGAAYQGKLTNESDKWGAAGTMISGVGSMFRSLSMSNPYSGYGGTPMQLAGGGYAGGYGPVSGYGPTVGIY